MTITPGDFVAFISYLGLLTWPMMALGWVTNLIQRGRASLDRINRILETPPEVKNQHPALRLRHLQGRIEFREVDFAYNPDGNGNSSRPVLSGISLAVEPGKVLGIVGPPGSGKTTLLSLIPRLYDVIRENIAFDNPMIKENRLEEISQKAILDDTIRAFPNGFDTMVGEKGVILSGGQKQRIALARCLLQETGVLILDDPTSQVDLETGTAMIDTIKSMIGQKTIIIVSHRISAVSFADQIIALEQGKMIEQGTHRDLIATRRYYAKAFQLQEYEAGVNAS
jgi:ATP-binding cassette subfamily B protein